MVIELVGCFGFFLDFLVGPAVIGLCCAPMAIMAIAVDALTAEFQWLHAAPHRDNVHESLP